MNPPRPFTEMHLPDHPTTVAPDGSDVRVLLALPGGSMAHFELAPGAMSAAVRHRSVDEIWYVLSGAGEMWRRGDGEATVGLGSGTCLTIPAGTSFQFRNVGRGPLQVVAVTMPPWPGDGEAVLVDGCTGW
jgi:mannose-6-phosphate isomerase-like protein (cupin superfamily)